MNAIEWSPRITEPQAFSAPYPPSWVDRLTTWVAGLPGPTWTYYLGLWVLLFSLMTTVQWSQGGYPVGTFNLFHLVYTGVSLAMLLLIRSPDVERHGISNPQVSSHHPTGAGHLGGNLCLSLVYHPQSRSPA